MNTKLRASPLKPWPIWAAVLIANLAIACFLYSTVGWFFIRGYREVTTFLIYPVIIVQAGGNLALCLALAAINVRRKSNPLHAAALAHLTAAPLLLVSLPIAPLVGSVLKYNFILRTSIVDAAAYQDAELVKLHLQRGTDPNTRGRPGLNATALHYMTYGDNTDVVELLLQKGADPNARANIDLDGRTALDLANPGPEGSLLRAALNGISVDSLPRDAPSAATPPGQPTPE